MPKKGLSPIHILLYMDRIVSIFSHIGQNLDSVQIQENTDTILSAYEKIRIRESHIGLYRDIGKSKVFVYTKMMD